MRPIALLILALAGATPSPAEPTITLQNHQPFAWRLPVSVTVNTTNAGLWRSAAGPAVQITADKAWWVADLPASATQVFDPRPPAAPGAPQFKIDPDADGVRLIYSGQPLGRLQWSIATHPAASGQPTNSAPEDFAAGFKPLPLEFHPGGHGPVFDIWRAQTTEGGLGLQIELRAFAGGFLDIDARLSNESADARVKTYAAVVCRWQQPKAVSQTLCYDNHILGLGAHDRSPFHAGAGRQQFVQRGADWTRTALEGGTVIAWLNDFAPSFTVIDNTSNNPLHAPRYAGANLSQLGREVQTADGQMLAITEIARSNTKSFSDRVTDNVLPARGEAVGFSSRLILTNAAFTTGAVDQAFVAYAGYRQQQDAPGGTALSFGVPSIRFGTSYFPYSTLGENFDDWKLPGMDREAFWPLAADTVQQWRLFADDIRRDLRIAKAMGFQLIRLHHLELLAAIPADTRQDYLDFLFGELRRLQLRALVDVYASPEQLTALMKRYGDVIDTVELENETLIWGIPLDRPAQWQADYNAIKQSAPAVRVCLTGYNNTGMFDRLRQSGVPFDGVDLHSYIDSVEAIPSGRGYALAVGNYAAKTGKVPMISEWNWRGLTKMSEAERARIYPPIIDNVLATRAVSDFYEFQFNETLAPNPRLGRGNLLRHYELLNLSRRPKLEAFELMRLIERYSAPNDPVRIIGGSHESVQEEGRTVPIINFHLTNNGAASVKLHAVVEASDGVTAELKRDPDMTVAPGGSEVIPVHAAVTNAQPGFYHVFVRLESDRGFVRYLWAEVRVPGTPQIEAGPELKFDLSRPVTVAYGAKATVLEVETAFAIGQTLESATGRVVPIVPLDEVANPAAAHLIYVGPAQEAPLGQDWLMITGRNSRAVEEAGMSFILRYWKFAKDSAARRVGLARQDLPRGGDAAKLP